MNLRRGFKAHKLNYKQDLIAMKMLLYTLIFFAIILSRKDSNATTLNKDNSNDKICLKIRNVNTSKKVSLSDILEKVQFIRLDPQNKILLDKRRGMHIGKKYIIYFDYYHGVIQFTKSGEFLRILVPFGDGPNEINGTPKFCFSRNETQLYVNVANRPKTLLRIDLESGKFFEEVPIAIPGFINSMEILNDSTILIYPGINDKEKCFLFTQTTSGKLYNKIIRPDLSSKSSTSRDLFFKVKNKIYFNPLKSDTIFSFHKELIPELYFDHNNQLKNGKYNYVVGNISCKIDYINESFILFNTTHYISVKNRDTQLEKWETEREYIIYNKKSKKLISLESFKYDDFFNKEIRMFSIHKFHNNGYVSIILDAISALELREQVLQGKVKISHKEEFLKVTENMKENDNPVLMIGEIKKEIDF